MVYNHKVLEKKTYRRNCARQLGAVGRHNSSNRTSRAVLTRSLLPSRGAAMCSWGNVQSSPATGQNSSQTITTHPRCEAASSRNRDTICKESFIRC
mmetsp:Transcript_19145/g.44584  ORF Transcript_19145/g.44584 Transcript_19145/m.44584 type:complete len:96 (+) Transcript_19145:167-454(+)